MDDVDGNAPSMFLAVSTPGGLLNSEQSAVRLRERKSRCDGRSPCGVCLQGKAQCEYASDVQPEQVKVEESYSSNGMTLVDSFRRMHYLELFMKYVQSFFPIMTIRMEYISAQEATQRTLAEQLHETVALSIAARSIGHMEVHHGTFYQARVLAARLSERCDGNAAALFLMGVTQLGEDMQLAKGYLQAARAAVTNTATGFHAEILAGVLKRVSLLDKPVDPAIWDVPALTEPVAFPVAAPLSERFDANSMFRHPMLMDIIGALRRFPVHLEHLDSIAYAHTIPIGRLPLDQRTNTPLDGHKTELMLLSLELGQETLIELAVELDYEPSTMREFLRQKLSQTWGMRMLICLVGGLTTLGAHYARETMDILQTHSGLGAGFNLHHMLPGSFALGCFLITYRDFLQGCKWTSMVLELCDTLRPIQQYRVIRELEAACMRAMNNKHAKPVPPSPDDAAVSARWLAPEHRPMDLDQMYEAVQSRLASRGPPLTSYWRVPSAASTVGSTSRSDVDMPDAPRFNPSTAATGSVSACPPAHTVEASPSAMDTTETSTHAGSASPVSSIAAPAAAAPLTIADFRVNFDASPPPPIRADYFHPGMVSPVLASSAASRLRVPPPTITAPFGSTLPLTSLAVDTSDIVMDLVHECVNSAVDWLRFIPENWE